MDENKRNEIYQLLDEARTAFYESEEIFVQMLQSKMEIAAMVQRSRDVLRRSYQLKSRMLPHFRSLDRIP